ncbi:DUF4232 domain-containing protein [Corynebacterium aquilae]|uniref:DUF4232 domain-containing protein n=1 Tax=Corynebacterium aquilae TaxID=203263 RepID=UPI0009523702|nr:DUF4232 domain-containing protein [Corynebacterium aquilae]
MLQLFSSDTRAGGRLTLTGACCLALLTSGCSLLDSQETDTAQPQQLAADSSPADTRTPTPDADATQAPDSNVVAAPSDTAEHPIMREACQPQQLAISVTPTDAGAGHQYYAITATNNGPHCTLAGFPGISAVDAQGQQIGAAAEREDAHDPGPVRLGPKGQAQATLRLTNAHLMDPATCAPTPAAGLKIYPPNSYDSTTVPFDSVVCAKGATTLTTGPFTQK